MCRILVIVLFLNFFFIESKAVNQNYLVRCNLKLVEVIMEDLFTPTVASRVKVYPNIAAFEILCKKDQQIVSLQNKLNQFNGISDPKTRVDFSLSALFAFTTVAKKLVYSEYMFTDFEKVESSKWLPLHKNDSILLNQSVEYGTLVAQEIIAWMKKDNYDYTRTLSRYVLTDTVGAWIPTGPGYANALEPNWPLMRSFVFDSNTFVKAIPNIKYSEDKKSVYFRNAMAIYNQSLHLDKEKKQTALYWDDNPNVLKSDGHVNYFIHKVSPSGHWMRIASQAIKNNGLNEFRTAELYTLMTLAIYEAFISCWKEKFISNSLRPETYINRMISPQWKSFIETPPFPEYTSGHSVMSSACATILTALIPQPYAFTDSSVMYINLPPRRFKSFREASNQASISRFYGGIHYMPSLDNGIIQGKEIGDSILRKIKTRQ